MGKEEILNKYVKLIDKGYCCDCNELNCIDNFPHKKIASAICDLQLENFKFKEQLKEQKEIIDKVNNYLDNYDVFKVFSFPLMKKWEEQEVKSSIDYEFKKSLIKDLKEILEDKEV